MKQIIQNTRTGKLSLHEVPEPKVRPGHILVRTGASLISAGTERLVIEFASKSLAGKARARPDLVKKVLAKAKRDGIKATTQAVLARLDEPLPLGYSAAGQVMAVGGGLEGSFKTGQLVAVGGSGLANHAELNVVPANLAAAIPHGVPDDEACYATVGAIAMHAVRNLGASLGDVVAVVGVGLIGQLAAQLLTLSGARVAALDYDEERLELARRLGAEAALNLNNPGLDEAISDLSGAKGCDGVLIAAATQSDEPFRTAGKIARDRARVCLVGFVGTSFPYREFMQKELNIVVSRSYGPGRYDHDFEDRGVKYPEGWVRWTESENIKECLRLMSLGPGRGLDVAALTTHRMALDDAEKAYAMIAGGSEPHLGVVLTYPDRPESAARPAFAKAKTAKGGCVLGMIGAGNFARSVLLPEIKKLKGVTLHTVATRRGATAEQAAKSFGFAHASADEAEVIDNPDIDAVLIATRHDSHADLTARALRAGKAVLVEKPLGLSRDEINRVIEARNSSDAFFQVGFNRRFAPMALKARECLAGISGTKSVLIRVNAGSIDRDSWINDATEGGGRVLGEVCHFVDLARYLVGSPISTVHAAAAANPSGPAEDLSVTMGFSDGSLATIVYTALGDISYSKELIEAYAGGAVISIDNFRTMQIASGGKVSNTSRKTQDKGFNGALKGFFAAVRGEGPPPIDEAELAETSIATIAIMESLQSGERVDL